MAELPSLRGVRQREKAIANGSATMAEILGLGCTHRPVMLRRELGNDWGASSAGRAREVYRRHFAETRAALDEFKPDVVVMFGDDQYENFKEDVVPPFAVLAYDGHEIEPWKN